MKPHQVIKSRLQVEGRQVPDPLEATHFSAPSRESMRRPNDALPPMPLFQQHRDDSDYEEIDHLPRYSNAPQPRSSSGNVCSLCGSGTPVVRCDMCGGQIFCASCNDMYHRHPKRQNHIRSLLEIVETRPPLPPRSMSIADPGGPPVRPPRRQKKFGMRSNASSPTSSRKMLFERVSSPRFPALSGDEARNFSHRTTFDNWQHPSVNRQNTLGSLDRRHNSVMQLNRCGPNEFGRNIPLSVLEMSNHNNRQLARLDTQQRQGTLTPTGMHFSDYAPHSSGSDLSASQVHRQQSSSTSQLNRFLNHSANLSHIATLQRKQRKAIVCGPVRPQPPPLPPKEFVPPPSSHSASAFDLHRIVDNRRPSTHSLHPSWQQSQQFGHRQSHSQLDDSSPQPYINQFDSRQRQPMGYFDQPHQRQFMKRTSSSSSMNSMSQPVFNPWSSFNSPHHPQDVPVEVADHDRFGAMEFKRSPSPNMPTYSNNFRRDERFLSRRQMQRNTPSPPPRPPPTQFQRRESSRPPSVSDDRVMRPAAALESVTGFQSLRASRAKECPVNRVSSPGSWQCEFCTLINAKEDKICTVCCKTPSSILEASNLSLDSMNLADDQKSSFQHDKKKSKGSRHSKMPNSPPPPPNQGSRREHKQAGLSSSKGHSGGTTSGTCHHKEKYQPKCAKKLREPSEDESSDDQQELDEDEDEEEDSSSSGIPPADIFPQTPSSSSESDMEFPLQLVKASRQRKIKSRTLATTSQHFSNKEEVNGKAHVHSESNTAYKHKPEEQNDFTVVDAGLSNLPHLETQNAKHGQSPESCEKSNKSAAIKSVLKKAIKVEAPFKNQTSSVTETLVQESKGTSPPPQSISTQTYEELPFVFESSVSESPNMPSTCSSVGPSSSTENIFDPPSKRNPKEMSDKELRYSRKAQQQSKLKRSMSTHLTGNEDPWTEAFEPKNLWRSSSRHSLANNDTWSLPFSGPPSRDPSPPPRGYHNFPNFQHFQLPSWERFSASPADYFASLENSLTNNRRRWGETSRQQQESELPYLLKEGTEYGFSPEELQIALRMSGNENPIKWLKENWQNMIETVQTLATNFGRDKGEYNNDVGTISTTEARESLRHHKGNVWASTTSCVEHRRAKFKELQSRGNFLREDILTALTINHGKLDAAFADLSKAHLKPFLMHVWGPPMQPDNEATPSLAGSTASSAGCRSFTGVPAVQNTALGPLQPFSELPRPAAAALPEVLEIHPDEDESEDEQVKANSNQPVQIIDNKVQFSMEAVLELLETQRNKILLEKTSVGSDSSLLVAKKIELQLEGLGTAVQPANESESELSSGQRLLTQDSGEPAARNLQQSLPITERNVNPTGISSQGREANMSQSNRTTESSPLQLDVQQSFQPVTEPALNPCQTEKLLNNTSLVAGSQSVNTEILIAAPDASMKSPLLEVAHESAEQTQLHAEEAPIVLAEGMPAVSAMLQTQQVLLNPVLSPTAVAAPHLQLIHSITETLVPTIPAPVSVVSISTSGVKNTGKPVSVPVSSIPLSSAKSDTSQQMTAVVVASKELVIARPTEPTMASYFSDELVLQQPEKDDNQKHVLKMLSNFPNKSLELQEDASSDEVGDYDDEVFVNEDEDDEEFDSQESQLNRQETGSETSESSEFDDEVTAKHQTLEQRPPTPVKVIHDRRKTTRAPQPKESDVPAEVALLPTTPAKEIKPAIKRLLDLGLSDSFESAELAAQLMDMKFTEEDSVIASKECSSLNSALSYLHQECHLCAGKYSAHQMVSMLRCTHWCCRTCAKDYFVVQIRDRGILDATCPFCKEPTNLLEDPDSAAEYFNHLDIILKNLIDQKYHEMFQRKLRDWALSKTPNFKWCSKCSSGFITEPLQTRLVCPDCSAVTCAVCLEPWTRTHDHPNQKEVKLCDAARSVLDYLNENSVECPRCTTKFALARGGCMHLTCSACKFEFCSGCSAPFRHADKCNKGPFCLKLGLHAHHPRNCLFYLRDKDPPFLTKLLQDFEIPYLSEEQTESEEARKCYVSIQKETQDGLQDDICGGDAPPGFASVCRAHYVEYLGLLIWQNHLDPVSILSNDDLETIIRRAHKKCPPRPYGIKDADYRLKLLEVIQQEIPL